MCFPGYAFEVNVKLPSPCVPITSTTRCHSSCVTCDLATTAANCLSCQSGYGFP